MMDEALQASMAALIEATRLRHGRHAAAKRAVLPAKGAAPLRILLAGYNGCRNTGSDVRVEEIVGQLHRLLQPAPRIRVLSVDPQRSQGYFAGAQQLRLPKLFPAFLARTVAQHDAVIACEGSMFKSQFADALSTMMTGALGLAVASGKPAIAYGGEAGAMTPSLERFVRRYARGALLLMRTEASCRRMAELGLPAELGTDTAWPFMPAPVDVAALLQQAGWDGRRPILTVCPVDAFCWPVKPQLGKALQRYAFGRHRQAHYGSLYFHRWDAGSRAAQAAYIAALAEGVGRFAAAHKAQVVIVGMEALDRHACLALAEALGGAPCFTADQHDMHTLVSLLRRSSWLLSSRYHALVTSMPAGVPSAGVTMDERIANLMHERRQPELCLRVDDPHLADSVQRALAQLATHPQAVAQGIDACVQANLQRLQHMGERLRAHLTGEQPGAAAAMGVSVSGQAPLGNPARVSTGRRPSTSSAPTAGTTATQRSASSGGMPPRAM